MTPPGEYKNTRRYYSWYPHVINTSTSRYCSRWHHLVSTRAHVVIIADTPTWWIQAQVVIVADDTTWWVQTQATTTSLLHNLPLLVLSSFYPSVELTREASIPHRHSPGQLVIDMKMPVLFNRELHAFTYYYIFLLRILFIYLLF